jgi:hypothetical protein
MDDQLSLLPDIEPLTFEQAAATLTAMETAIYNSAIDAAIASVNATSLTGPPDLVTLAKALLDAVAVELGGLKL